MKILVGGHGAVASHHRLERGAQPSIVNSVGEEQPSLCWHGDGPERRDKDTLQCGQRECVNILGVDISDAKEGPESVFSSRLEVHTESPPCRGIHLQVE